jgi:hypothetical protein
MVDLDGHGRIRMNKVTRNQLRNTIVQCRTLLERAVSDVLQGEFGIHTTGHIEPEDRLSHLASEDRAYREQILTHLRHIESFGPKSRDAVSQLVREASFTHLNRLCAYKMMSARGLIEDPVGKGLKSRGFIFYLSDHPDDEALYHGAKEDIAYRHYLEWLNEELSAEIGVLFAREDLATRLFPPYRVLVKVLDLINSEELRGIWAEDETIGWVYQYFTPKELRDKARKESAAPRDSYELAFRNQFYTPRYVVEFLVDNTLGRLWYEMRQGETMLKEQCRYLVRRPAEKFLPPGEKAPNNEAVATVLSQNDLLKQPVYIKHRQKRDPRDLKILDPACGSGHFLLYCFGLLEVIYEEAFHDAELGTALKNDYSTLADLKREVPKLIIERNLHGIDIDLRSTQISALALWLRAQRAYKELGIEKNASPQIRKTNIVCAEPMPGERELLEEFLKEVYPPFLADVVRVVFYKMQLAGEAGSLLKIEEEINSAIAEAKKHWRAIPKQQQLALFRKEKLSDGKQGALFDLSGITDEEFWNEAEARVLESLDEYAQHTVSNGQGLRRRLFADDAVQGFAFVDICRKLFDVVLMNPPFGSPSIKSKEYIVKQYPNCKEDLDASFVRRGVMLLGSDGFLGAIINRTQFFKPTLGDWREDVLLGRTNFVVAADLGYGVLDTALVEAASYVLRKPSDENHVSLFFRLLKTENKESELRSLISQRCYERPNDEIFLIQPLSFRDLPETRISYWASNAVRNIFKKFRKFEGAWGSARQGLATADDFRFVRLTWECPPTSLATTLEQMNANKDSKGKRWVSFAKGGEYQTYFQDLHLTVNWKNDGSEIRNFHNEAGKLASRPQNLSYYFKPALTYTERTASGFSPRVLPPGCIFGHKGPIISPHEVRLILPMLALFSSRVVANLIELSMISADAASSGSAARDYTQGIIGSIPIPPISASETATLSELANAVWKMKCKQDSMSETSRYFVAPSFFAGKTPDSEEGDIHRLIEAALQDKEEADLAVIRESWEIEKIIQKLYELDPSSIDEIEREFGKHPETLPKEHLEISDQEFIRTYSTSIDEAIYEEVEASGGRRALTKKSYFADRKLEILSTSFQRHPQILVNARRRLSLVSESQLYQHGSDLISYALGCVFGRWDVRFAAGKLTAPETSDPLAPVPVSAPGALSGADGLPLTEAPKGYSLHINSDGVLVDDPTHEDDILSRVRAVFEMIWPKGAEDREREACELLGVKELRDYFRRPSAGGFWMDHVKRYSKSRRKAPLYWYQRSSKGNYALWFYYHRLDKDILHKARVNYVEPKLRLEENNLAQLRERRETVGTTGREAKQLEKDLDKQESFISELHDFHDKLKRAADLNLEPDLNDGVVLNIAPLWELVPWTEAKKYWNELLDGKYEWSSIAKQLRNRGLVKI